MYAGCGSLHITTVTMISLSISIPDNLNHIQVPILDSKAAFIANFLVQTSKFRLFPGTPAGPVAACVLSTNVILCTYNIYTKCIMYIQYRKNQRTQHFKDKNQMYFPKCHHLQSTLPLKIFRFQNDTNFFSKKYRDGVNKRCFCSLSSFSIFLQYFRFKCLLKIYCPSWL